MTGRQVVVKTVRCRCNRIIVKLAFHPDAPLFLEHKCRCGHLTTIARHVRKEVVA